VHPRSAAIVKSIGLGDHLHADFGSGLYQGRPIGIPYTTVKRTQKRVPVSFQYADESDRGPYPIPRNAPVEGGRSSDGDRHVIVVDRPRCRLYELFAAYPENGGARWRAGSWRRLEPSLEPHATARLDLGRRRRPADSAGAGPLRRGQARPHRPRAALHRQPHAQGLPISGASLRLGPDRPRPPARWASACA